ncbi:MAG: pyruvate phosphate dikinase [Planctomycetes bacterium DG_23]|nr:MAG: pyruvate phosphate dikinase [Planctomycetes bacterium DG_23]
MPKYVYFFGDGKADGSGKLRPILGGKGADLAEMTLIGLPVPPGFTITTEVCRYYYENGGKFPEGLDDEMEKNLEKLEQTMEAGFGDPENPLMVSVRSGAAVSMPGMMDTVLNLGLNDKVVEALAKKTGNERFAWDAYRRLIHMFGDVVMGVEHEKFEEVLSQVKKEVGAELDTQLETKDLKKVVAHYKELYKRETGEDFPQEPRDQLKRATEAVFKSWNIPRAVKYRQIHRITGLLGTAASVQTMVFGNMGETSGTGVGFTRNPATGENALYGEYLLNAQGEDVVAGIRTPQPISHLAQDMPKIHSQLLKIKDILEHHFKDMQDFEFTFQNGRLFMLQTRTGKRTAFAATKIACDMMDEGLIDQKTAVLRMPPEQIDHLLHPTFDPKAEKKVIAKGLPASPGAATGKAVFDADTAEDWASHDEKVILVRLETSPEDIGGMNAAQGILTARGGMTSHAAVVARGMGKCCVAGCGALEIDYENKQMKVREHTIKEGDFISLDGAAGELMLGEVSTVEPTLSGDFARLMEWADKFRKIGVRTNADTPHDAKVAREFGAEGIGLTRTEHMFFEGDRILAMREMILAEDSQGRAKALEKLLPMQRGDFEGIFREMAGLPVTIRLFDPPLHEFLPKEEASQREMAQSMGVPQETIKAKVQALSELNPMLGLRGCRLGIVYPEVYDMQTRGILEAACRMKKEGVEVLPEIMIPLVGAAEEFVALKARVMKIAKEVFAAEGLEVDYLTGTMIEVPRACITADEIAKEAEFFSYGTNDLTQMTYGFSRDDVGSFVPRYVEEGILPKDPFQSIDEPGVGELVKIGIEKGRKARPDLKVGICGEHGGEAESVKFCHRVGMNYVSCSPFRVPIARLAAAHAALEEEAAKSEKK